MVRQRSVWATLLTARSYLPGVLVLAHSLRSVNSAYPLVVMITPELDNEAREALRAMGLKTREIEKLLPGGRNAGEDKLDERFRHTWTKLRTFELTEYERVVQLDADMIVRQNMDELMEVDLPNDGIAAAHVCACNPRKIPTYPPYWVPKNCPYTPQRHPDAAKHASPASMDAPIPYRSLNSGTVVLTPCKKTMDRLVHFLSEDEHVLDFVFPDQDALSAFFDGRWKPLPWVYNALKTLRDIHPDMWNDGEVRCLHYILKDKPWQNKTSSFEVDGWWWDVYRSMLTSMAEDEHKALVRSLVE